MGSKVVTSSLLLRRARWHSQRPSARPGCPRAAPMLSWPGVSESSSTPWWFLHAPHDLILFKFIQEIFCCQHRYSVQWKDRWGGCLAGERENGSGMRRSVRIGGWKGLMQLNKEEMMVGGMCVVVLKCKCGKMWGVGKVWLFFRGCRCAMVEKF